MTNEQLCLLAQNGDADAVEKLVNKNAGFVRKIAKEINSKYGNAEIDDLVQEGELALWKCIDKFDETSGANFLTFAKYAIKSAMTDLVRKSISSDRLPRISFDDYILDEERLLLSELISDSYSKSPEQIFFEVETIRNLYSALGKLEARERTYLLYRFGFEEGKEHTVADTALHFSLSESRARATEKAAISKMRKLMFL